MIAVISGSRSITDEDYVRACLNEAWRSMGPIHTLHHGNARGVDRIAARIVRRRGVLTPAWDADWDFYGRPAGLIRNMVMIKNCGADYGIAVWDGRSKGTRHALEVMAEIQLPHLVFVPGRDTARNTFA